MASTTEEIIDSCPTSTIAQDIVTTNTINTDSCSTSTVVQDIVMTNTINTDFWLADLEKIEFVGDATGQQEKFIEGFEYPFDNLWGLDGRFGPDENMKEEIFGEICFPKNIKTISKFEVGIKDWRDWMILGTLTAMDQRAKFADGFKLPFYFIDDVELRGYMNDELFEETCFSKNIRTISKFEIGVRECKYWLILGTLMTINGEEVGFCYNGWCDYLGSECMEHILHVSRDMDELTHEYTGLKNPAL